MDTTRASSKDSSAITVAPSDNDRPLIDLVLHQPDHEESILAGSLGEADKPDEEREMDEPDFERVKVPGLSDKVQVLAPVAKRAKGGPSTAPLVAETATVLAQARG